MGKLYIYVKYIINIIYFKIVNFKISEYGMTWQYMFGPYEILYVYEYFTDQVNVHVAVYNFMQDRNT